MFWAATGSVVAAGGNGNSGSNGNSGGNGNSNGNGNSGSGTTTSSGNGNSGSSGNGNSNGNGNSGSGTTTSSGNGNSGSSGNGNSNGNGNSGSNGNSGNGNSGGGSTAIVPCLPLQPGCLAPLTTINLLTAGSSGSANGALYVTTIIQPTGTGVIEPFLRIQILGNQSGSQDGYNADYSHSYQPNFDEKTGKWTHSVPISSLMPVTINGSSYFQFLLDVNQTAVNPLLSLNDVKIFSNSVSNPSNGSNVNGLGNLIFDMDIGPDGDVTVNLNYLLGHGSGSGDMYLFVPTANFAGHTGFMIFYSSFGNPDLGNAGFEEWTVLTNPSPPPNNPVPEPGSLLLFGTGLFGVAAMIRRRFEK